MSVSVCVVGADLPVLVQHVLRGWWEPAVPGPEDQVPDPVHEEEWARQGQQRQDEQDLQARLQGGRFNEL